MKKLVGVLLTLAVMLGLNLVPVVTSASPDGIELYHVNNGTAEISTAAAHSPTHSVKLYVKDGGTDWAEVSIPVDIALKDISTLKLWEYIDLLQDSGWDVNVILGVDCNDNGTFDSDVADWHIGTVPHTAAALAGDSFAEMDGALGPLSGDVSWIEINALTTARWWTPNKTGNGLSSDLYCSFSDMLSKIATGTSDTNIPNTGVKVLCVKLLIGGSGSWMDETAYVDDVTIIGVTYDFEPSPPSSGCFIATAAYGTPMAEEIQVLREFRDQYLLTNPVGEALVEFYYKVSPPMAEFITEHPTLKPVVRVALVPAVAMSTVAVNTTLAQKIAIVGSMVLLSALLVVWFRRRAGRGSTS